MLVRDAKILLCTVITCFCLFLVIIVEVPIFLLHSSFQLFPDSHRSSVEMQMLK